MPDIDELCRNLQKFDDEFVTDTAKLIATCDANRNAEFSDLKKEHEKCLRKLEKNSAKIKALTSSNKSLMKKLENRDAKIEKIMAKLHMMTKQAFGSKSDRLEISPAPTEVEEKAALNSSQKSQNEASSEAIKVAADKAKWKKKKNDCYNNGVKKKGKQPRRHGNEAETEVVDHGGEHCFCGCGGTILSYTVTREWVTVPARHYCVEHRFPKYRCRLEDRIKSYVREKRALPGMTTGASMLAYFTALKFDWFLPTYRQERILKQEGVFVHRSTISRSINAFADRILAPIADAIYNELVNNSDVLHVDETSHYLLMNGRGKTKKRSLISIARDERGFGGARFPAAFYRMFPSNTQSAYEELFSEKKLILTHDGHASYNKLNLPGTPLADITSAGCWSHVRRYFVDAHNILKTKKPASIVAQIDRLFKVERKMNGFSARIRKRVRKKVSSKIIAHIHKALQSLGAENLIDNHMGRAVRYTLRRWKQLTKFLYDGRIEIHNNTVERAFKSPILLRNASMFSASQKGEKAWAICFTLSETCRMNGVNFYRYLLWVLDEFSRLDGEIDHRLLMPWGAPDDCHTQVTETS